MCNKVVTLLVVYRQIIIATTKIVNKGLSPNFASNIKWILTNLYSLWNCQKIYGFLMISGEAEDN